jgi:hypothetical protein
VSRPLRIEYPGAFYHVTSRGNERRTVFQSNGRKIRGQAATFNRVVKDREGVGSVEAAEDRVSGSILSCDLPWKRKKDSIPEQPG